MYFKKIIIWLKKIDLSFLRKKAPWFALYGISITIFFLYLLFPCEMMRNYLESTIGPPDFSFKAQSLHTSLPMGIKLKEAEVSSAPQEAALLQMELIDLQPGVFSILQKKNFVDVRGQAYGGTFSGRISLISWNKLYPPRNAKLKFQNIDLIRCNFPKIELGKEISGKLSGDFYFNNVSSKDRNTVETFKLLLTKGNYPLSEPFLGLNRIDFDRCIIEAKMKSGILEVEKLEVSGSQINCTLKGTVTLAGDLKSSQLNLGGVIEILAKNKIKANLSISGTLADPVSRYM